MQLQKLLERLPQFVELRGSPETEINTLTCNSREKTDRGLFFCIPGTRVDSHSFAPQAVQNGCVALVVEHWLDVDAVQVLVTDSRAAMSRMAAAFNGYPADHLRLIGITGTKGKTTTSYMVKSILTQAGRSCGLIGTTGNMIGNRMLPSHLTTPDPVELQATLREMVEAGVQDVVMEVSAHALDMRRLDGMVFEAGCYTNLSQDHLDYFHTMENYFEAKKKFFTTGMVKNGAFNSDEETTAKLTEGLQLPSVTYGICEDSDLFARNIEISENGVSFEIQLQGLHVYPVHLRMTGMFNVYNALAAAACALIVGVSGEDICRGLEAIASVPGRVEMLPTGTPYKVILDYSHSPDALDNILRTVRTFTRGKLIALFGCGGDRDRGKRPMMGEIGGRLADYCILTSDNPRTEDPMAILAAIEEGIRPTGGKYTVIENRRDAIRYALHMAADGDIIVLAGKGHETYQEIQGVRHPFDEKQVVQEPLAEK